MCENIEQGLFFKKHADKIKHPSLKRTKSGLYTERKKTSICVMDDLTSPQGQPQAQAQAQAQAQPQQQQQQQGNETSVRPSLVLGAVNSTSEPIAGRRSLPSPMRVTRSHESLFSASSSTPATTADADAIRPFGHADNTDNYRLTHHIDYLTFANNTTTDTHPHFVTPVHSSLLHVDNCIQIMCEANQMSFYVASSSSTALTAVALDSSENETEHETNATNVTTTCRRYASTPLRYAARFVMLRGADERDKWLQCLRELLRPERTRERHDHNSLHVCIMEAKGPAILAKANKRYACDVHLATRQAANSAVSGGGSGVPRLVAKTSLKAKSDILFWGESFDVTHVCDEYMRVELYQHTIESHKKSKSRSKDVGLAASADSAAAATSTPTPSSSSSSSSQTAVPTSSTPNTTATATASSSSSNAVAGSSLSSLHRTLVGYLTIPFASLEANQTVEKWYKLELATAASHSTSFLGTNGMSGGGGSGTLSGRYDASSSSIASLGSFSMAGGGGGGQHMQPVTSSPSALTTEGFSKDSVTIRVKIKYQNLDILPLAAYRRLIHVRSSHFMLLVVRLTAFVSKMKKQLQSKKYLKMNSML